MARNDGIHRTVARNNNLSSSQTARQCPDNEREKESYANPDIIPERLAYNVHYKSPTGSYTEMFEQLKADGIISTRGLKDDAKTCCGKIDPLEQTLQGQIPRRHSQRNHHAGQQQ